MGGFDFLLLISACPSMQIDNPQERFFLQSRRTSGSAPRIRKPGSVRQSAWNILPGDELAGMLYENSDEPYCEELAKAITDEIRKGETT